MTTSPAGSWNSRHRRGENTSSLIESPEPADDASTPPRRARGRGGVPAIDTRACIPALHGSHRGCREGGQESSPSGVRRRPRPVATIPPDRPSAAASLSTGRKGTDRRLTPDLLLLNLEIPALPPRVELDEEIRQAFLGRLHRALRADRAPGPGPRPGGGRRRTLHELGRCFHTLKGAAGSVGIGRAREPGPCPRGTDRRGGDASLAGADRPAPSDSRLPRTDCLTGFARAVARALPSRRRWRDQTHARLDPEPAAAPRRRIGP